MFHHFSQDTVLITFAVLTVPGRGSRGCWVPAWGFRWHFFGVLVSWIRIQIDIAWTSRIWQDLSGHDSMIQSLQHVLQLVNSFRLLLSTSCQGFNVSWPFLTHNRTEVFLCNNQSAHQLGVGQNSVLPNMGWLKDPQDGQLAPGSKKFRLFILATEIVDWGWLVLGLAHDIIITCRSIPICCQSVFHLLAIAVSVVQNITYVVDGQLIILAAWIPKKQRSSAGHYPLVNKHRPWKSPIFNGN